MISNHSKIVTLPPYPFWKMVVWFFFFFYFCVSNAFIARRVWNFVQVSFLNSSEVPLIDVVHSIDTYISRHFSSHVIWLPDFFVFTNCFMVFVLALTYQTRWRIISIFFKIWGCLFAIRGFIMPLTILPSSINACRDEHVTMLSDLRENRDNYTPSGSMYCNDLIYSGHTAVNMLCFMFFLYSCKPKWLKAISLLCAFFGMCATVFTRDHYTVDVALAIVICVLFTNHYKKEIITAYSAIVVDEDELVKTVSKNSIVNIGKVYNISHTDSTNGQNQYNVNDDDNTGVNRTNEDIPILVKRRVK